MKTIFDGLFEFETDNDLDHFVNNMNKTSSLKILEIAFEFGQKRGLYSIQESYCLYKCLMNLKEDENKNNNLYNNDIDGNTHQ